MAERAALVTGGSSGIGLAIARALCEDGYGVTVSARRPDKLETAAAGLREEGFDVHVVPAQMTDEEQIGALFASHRDRYGRLDVLVNNAGVGIGEAMHEITTKKLDIQIGANLRGVIIATREGLPMLREAGAEHGKALIVNTASIAGKAGQGMAVGLFRDQGGRRRLQPGDAEGVRARRHSGDRPLPRFRRHADDRVRQGTGARRGDDPTGGHRRVGALPARARRRRCLVPEIVFGRPGEIV